MAGYVLIDGYLRELREETRWLRDAEQIAEELADHLLEAVERRIGSGLDRLAAQKEALAEFGDPELVGRAFISSQARGAAMPTQFTKRAGYALMASALMWVAGLAIGFTSDVADRTHEWEGLPQQLYMISAIGLVLGGLLTAAGVLGVMRRHGGDLGVAGRISFWLLLISGTTVFAYWFFALWLTALGIGAVLLSVALLRSGLAPRASAYLIGVGGAAAMVIVWIDYLADGEVSPRGVLNLIPFLAMGLYIVGLATLGRWMTGERVVDDPEHMAAV